LSVFCNQHPTKAHPLPLSIPVHPTTNTQAVPALTLQCP
jgi:hypothetical protein